MVNKIKRVLVFGAVLSLLMMPSSVLARGGLDSTQLHEFSQNNILYYDPTECNNIGGARPTGDQITWIGDSYSTGAKSLIEDKFSGISFGGSVNDDNSYIQSCKNVATDTSCGANPSLNPSGLKVLERIINNGELKPYLVMAVGTNEGWSEESIEKLKQLLSEASDTIAIMVTSRTNNSDYVESNERLRALTDNNDNYYLADWATVYDSKYFATDSIHPVDNGGYDKWIETIYNAFPVNTSGNGAATGNFDKIMTAKNADKNFFNGSGDVPSASWSDSDTESMKQLLETYGDLAYQLGDAVGAPYIAVLVQMRYEDPNSVCGRNNFWGNGCPPGTGAGGASIQGENLGEGFIQYGETLLNGYHDQAIGVTDPKKYLEAIGPTWVQGNINGAGYGSINSMRSSVDALQAYVDSPEGQEIVQQFGNYHGNGGGICPVNSGGSGDINRTAIELAWPIDEYGMHAWNDPNSAYARALTEVGLSSYGDPCAAAGGSCDVYVATVMRYSGADPDFYCCGVSGGFVLNYIVGSGKYEEVSNSLDSLQPGDIRIGPGHIELYVEVDGEPRIASASYCERSGDIGGYYDNSFKAYRLRR